MTSPRWRALRLLLWLIGLVATGLLAHALVVGHQARTRGIPEGFPPPVVEADVPLPGIASTANPIDVAAAVMTLGSASALGRSINVEDTSPSCRRKDCTELSRARY